ncbi:hypothetical protein BCV69DRAFT_89138 [Microstroma glucosiphilum]|uniref:Uncharacterized protein n=1 Tax=Pseudomicrostroma glucosiphilum TaxID=1684307 RepID=A0A316TWU3_9BASI|nr:hypothetical protein BCV69DRAFT_89138 [Pseudomicrostroma glucosiphilum]PWN17946.1 hypothetical protein BCV69DRAFT_89138 [Pseudomicrostroma glucosiphilum]
MDQLDSHQGQPRQLDDGLAALFQGSHPSSSSSSVSSSHGLLLSLSQTLHGLQAHPSVSVPQLQEEILPLLALPAPDGVSALLLIWKGAFEGKASEPTGYTSNEEVRINVQVALASARLLRNVVGLVAAWPLYLILSSNLCYGHSCSFCPTWSPSTSLSRNLCSTSCASFHQPLHHHPRLWNGSPSCKISFPLPIQAR